MEHKLLLVEDQAILLDLFRVFLQEHGQFNQISTAASVAEAKALAEEQDYDLVISDYLLPDGTGLDLQTLLCEKQSSDAKFILITAFYKPGYLEKALKAEVNGFLLKDTSLTSFLDSVKRVLNGETVIADEILKSSLLSPKFLSKKELSILELVLSGKSNKLIADKLFLSEGTVKNYLSTILKKTETSNRLEAAMYAQSQGWI